MTISDFNLKIKIKYHDLNECDKYIYICINEHTHTHTRACIYIYA
jgi:hypothetical protein